jgi:hypothetical protein
MMETMGIQHVKKPPEIIKPWRIDHDLTTNAGWIW